jgi:hypothetical protein
MTPLKKLLVGSAWSVAPRGPLAVGGWILGGLGITAGQFLTTAVGYLASTLVTSWAVSALTPKPASASGGTLVNQRDAAAPHDYVYGTVRKGGTITYIESTGDKNKFLHVILVLAGHEVNAINDIYIDDDIATIDANGFVTSQSWASKIRIIKYTGNQTAAPSLLLDESNQIDANFVGNGLAYLYIRLQFSEDVFPNGIPLFTAMVQGKKVFDPRTSTTAFSSNAALCIRDYLTTQSGLGDTAVNDTAFSASANVCDENITLAASGTEKRYTMNGVIKSDQTPGDILQQMMTSCAGTLFWGQGNWQLKVGYYTPPVKTLTLDDLRGPISLQTRQSMSSIFNSVVGTFNDATQQYVTVDYPKIESATFLAEDNGVDSPIDLVLPFTTSSATAQRIAKLTLFRAREQMTLSADFGMAGFQVQVGDIVSFTNSRYGWTAKEFEVIGWRFFADQDGGDLRVNLELRETSEAAFDWAAEESEIIGNNTNLPSMFATSEVAIELSTDMRLINEAVTGILIIDVLSDDPFATQFEVKYRVTGDEKFINLGRSDVGRFEALNITDGNYDVSARMINGFGIRGPWTEITEWYATIFADPPQDVVNFTGNVVGNSLHLTWDAVPDLDLSHYRIRYSKKTSGASYQNATTLVRKVPRPGVTSVVPARTGTYFIKAFDKLSNPSQGSASFVVQMTTSNLQNLNFVETIVENPSFAGSTTNAVVTVDDTGTYIGLAGSTLFDSTAGLFDSTSGFFDGGGSAGGFVSIGYYVFSKRFDLGAIYGSRIRSDMDVDFKTYDDIFEQATGNFDSRPGNFDGDVSQFDTTSAKTQVRYTNDDPSASPTWSAWQDFTVTDIIARAMQFRAVLESESTQSMPVIRSLSARIDMTDRVEAESDITYTGSYTVTYPAGFKINPALGISATLATGDRYAISAKTRSGFTITTYTGASVSVNPTTFDYVAKGYGRETA